MFNATFFWKAWGNDVTTGTASPYNTSRWTALPLGHDCQSAEPYSANGSPNPRYCGQTTFMQGVPGTGSGYLLTGGATVGGPIGLPTSAFHASATGFAPTYYPYLQTHTYADFVNEAGSFFAGGGAAAGKGTFTHSGMGQEAGTWIIHEGKNSFGGVMGLLGAAGAVQWRYVVTGKAGTYYGGGDWNLVGPNGRVPFATPTQFTAMGAPSNWKNPHDRPATYINNLNGNTSRTSAMGSGTPWTTGSVTLYALVGAAKTSLHAAGYDIVTGTPPNQVRNIQLVTPNLSHWIGTGFQQHTGHIGILTLRIVPEPTALVLLAAGAGILALLYRVSRRR
jgi:hypothetical protein